MVNMYILKCWTVWYRLWLCVSEHVSARGTTKIVSHPRMSVCTGLKHEPSSILIKLTCWKMLFFKWRQLLESLFHKKTKKPTFTQSLCKSIKISEMLFSTNNLVKPGAWPCPKILSFCDISYIFVRSPHHFLYYSVFVIVTEDNFACVLM